MALLDESQLEFLNNEYFAVANKPSPFSPRGIHILSPYLTEAVRNFKSINSSLITNKNIFYQFSKPSKFNAVFPKELKGLADELGISSLLLKSILGAKFRNLGSNITGKFVLNIFERVRKKGFDGWLYNTKTESFELSDESYLFVYNMNLLKCIKKGSSEDFDYVDEPGFGLGWL